MSIIARPAASPRASQQSVSRWRLLLAFAGSSIALELVLLLGILRPLSIRRFPEVVPTPEALATALGTDWTGALRLLVPVLCAFAAFAVALWLARRLSSRVAMLIVLGGTLLFSVTLLPINPLGAHDAYYHVGNARTLWLYGDNPAVMPPITHADDPFYPHVVSWEDFPSAYGPIWYGLSGVLQPFVGDGLWPNVLALKAITAASLVAATILAMLLAEQIRPGAAVAAGVLVGWNPLLQWETAGNGHNDVVIAVFALAALYAAARRWWVAIFPLLALSVLTKYVLVLLGPVLVLWLWRRRDVPRRQLLLSLALGLLVGLACYAPFFAGWETLMGFRRQANLISSSPAALLHTLLWKDFYLDGTQAAVIMKLLVVPPYLIAYSLLLTRIPRNGTLASLIHTSFWVVFLLLTTVTWWFWPWYLGFLVPFGALLPGSRLALVSVLFSLTAMLMYIPHYWLLGEDRLLLDAATALVAFPLPVLLAIWPYLRTRLAGLLGAGLALELVLLLGLLQPLSIQRLPYAIPTAAPVATALGTDWAGALRLLVPVLCAFAAFAVALWLAARLTGRGAILGVLGGTLLCSLTLLSVNPLAGQDIYHNIADARTLWRYGDNPTVLSPITHADDPLYPYVAAWEDYPSVYGPVWYALSGGPLPFAGDSLWRNVIGQKALAALFLLGTTTLVMLLAEQIRPGAAVAAGVLVGWNPLLQWETAGNAHNDVVMIFFALAALYAAARRWWVAIFPLLALSVLTKYVLVLLGPVLVLWLWRRRDVPRRQLLLSLALGLLVGIVCYTPFFAGWETVRSFGREGANPTSSPGALVYSLVAPRLAFDRAAAATVMRLVLVPPFLVAYAALLWRFGKDQGIASVARTSFWVVFLFLVLVKWWFWPWYLLWLVPFGALLPGSRLALISAVFSMTAMLVYVPYYWLLQGDAFRILVRDAFMPQVAIVATGFLVPVLLTVARRPRTLERLVRRTPAPAK